MPRGHGACNAGMHASVSPGLLLEGVTRLEHSKSVWLSQARSAQMRSASAVARSLPEVMQVCQECMVEGLATLTMLPRMHVKLSMGFLAECTAHCPLSFW